VCDGARSPPTYPSSARRRGRSPPDAAPRTDLAPLHGPAGATLAVVDAATQWRDIETAWLARSGIGTKQMLRTAGLTGPAGKVFASLADDRLLLKLPAGRVEELITSGVGQPFSSGSRVMKEWVTVGVEDADRWDDLVAEAHAFAG
jgi:hypothetical protein